MMNFLIDLGNTNCKVVFEENGVLGEIVRSGDKKDIDAFVLEQLHDKTVDVIVFSNVRDHNPALHEELAKRCRKLVVLDYQTELPVNLNYQFAAEKLGADRIAGALAAAMLFKGRDCIKFDFGTALTVDFINQEGTFLGGNISLGMTSRFRALNAFTKRLPLISPVEDIPDAGIDTEGAMTAGVVFGLMFEVEGYINKHPDHKIIFTGGDGHYIAGKMNKDIFVAPNLVLMGLAYIADYHQARM